MAGGLGEGDPRLPCRAPAGGLSTAAFMRLDADVVAVSPSNVYQVLSDIDIPGWTAFSSSRTSSKTPGSRRSRW